MKKLAVTNKTRACVDDNNVIGASTGTDSAPRLLAAEIYGGGTEYLPFSHLPLWPFSWIRLFAQEE